MIPCYYVVHSHTGLRSDNVLYLRVPHRIKQKRTEVECARYLPATELSEAKYTVLYSIQYELPHACGHKVHHGGPRPPFYQRHGQPDAKLRLYESVTIEVRLDWGEITNAPTMNKAF